MATQEEVRKAVLTSPLATRAEDILRSCRPGVELVTSPGKLDEIPLGASRIGGVPDLPPGARWPFWKGEPQSFLAQISLSDISGMAGTGSLPKGGHLSFFYSARQDTWGFDPKDRGSWAISYSPQGMDLRRAHPPVPVPDGGEFHPCHLTFRSTHCLPAWESKDLESLGLDEPATDAYFDLVEALTVEDHHQLLGHPEQVQGDMAEECQLVSHGLYAGDPSGWESPRALGLRSGWSRWRLLLQVASDDAAGMMWSDAGFVFYWIPEEELVVRNFDAAWMILQCF